MSVRIEVTAGGEPAPAQTAALVVAVELLVAASPAVSRGEQAPAASEWALQGRMADLHWAPIVQRWPGEPPGRSWRRVLS